VMIKPAVILAFGFLAFLSPRRFWLFALIHGLVLGSLSLFAFGLDLHLELVRKVLGGSTLIAQWEDNSSLYIVPEHLRRWTLENSGDAASRMFTAIVHVIRLGVLATLAFVFWLGRKRHWGDPGRRHFAFHLALLFFLLFSTIVWEHYLVLLFPWLALLVARRDAVSRPTLTLVVGVLALSVLQNLIISRFILANFAIDTLVELLLILAYKSGPLWLVWFLLLRHRESVFAAYEGFGLEDDMVTAA